MRRLEGESCDKCGPLVKEAVGEALYFDRPTAAANLAEQNSRMAKRERANTVYARVAREVIVEPGEAQAGAGDANEKRRQF
jgi:hypothetical protein